MEKTVSDGNLEYKFHIGREDSSLFLTALITNISEDEVTFTTNMGSWCKIFIYDNTYDVERLEPTLSTAAIKDWRIPSGKSIAHTRKTKNPDELDFELERVTDVSFVDDAEEYINSEDTVSFVSNIDLNKEKDLNADLEAVLDFEFENSQTIVIEFSPKDVTDEKLDLDDYNLI